MPVEGTITQRPWAARVASLALLASGIFLLKMCVFDVLETAKRYENVSVHMKGVLLAPALIFFGLVAAVATFTGSGNPSLANRFVDPRTRQLSGLSWGVVIAVVAVGGGLYVWMRTELSAYGYEF